MRLKKTKIKKTSKNYQNLLDSIGAVLIEARQNTYRQINTILVKTYWEIGRHIVVYEQASKEKADYGMRLVDMVAKDLRRKYGKGFSRSNVFAFRKFYLKYPKVQAVPGLLSWTHITLLLSIEDNTARAFYERESAVNHWSTRELERRINSMLFERIALSKDKKGVRKLALKGQYIDKPEDIIKDPYVLEFLGIPENFRYSEKILEQRIIDNMQNFLLEMGKGFSFVARQYRISLNNRHFYIDLVFYHRILKCFVLIDLKLGAITHQDIGQMNLYLNYFKKEEKAENDNEPVGIVLGAQKDHVLVEYALGGISNKLFASKYLLSLPDKRVIQKTVEKIIIKKEKLGHLL